MIIAPSILSADFAKLGEELATLEKAGADWVHVDVMDGHFVPNLTFGPPVIKKIRPHTQLPFDVHLMISNADDFLEEYATAGADIITVHVEAIKDPTITLQKIRALGKKSGLSLKPGTSAKDVLPYLRFCDVVLVMTVEPGFGGQSFMSEQLEKIMTIRQWIDEMDHHIFLEVDGGISPKTIGHTARAGADAFVAGSAVFGSNDYENNINLLRQNITE